MRDDMLQPSKDSFDEAIRNALQVDIDQQRLESLEHYWTVQSKRQRRRQKVKYVVPLAAAVVTIVGAFMFTRHQSEEDRLTKNSADSSTRPEGSRDVGPFPLDEDLTSSLSAGRLPTAYERLMFAARTKERLPVLAQVDGIEQAIAQLTLDPSQNAKEVLDSIGFPSNKVETLLLRKLPRASRPQQTVVLRLLAVCGTQRTVPVLLRLGKNDALGEEVLATIEQIAGVDKLAEVVELTGDRQLRSELMLRLLSNNSDSALRGYLSLVLAYETRSEALTVAKDVPQLPIAAFLAFLDDEDRRVRLSAALVLGQVNGLEVTKQLIARVTNKPSNSTEAWLALFACRGDLADEFLSYATQQPKLLGHCNNARLQWAQMIP